SEELVYVSTAKDTPSKVALAELVDVDWLFPASPSGSRHVIDMAFSRMDKTPRVVAELSSATALKAAVLSGYGSTIIPAAVIMDEVKKGLLTIASFSDVSISRPLSLCVHSNVPLSPAGQHVHEVAISLVKALIAERPWPTIS